MFWRSDLLAVAQAGNSSDADPVARWLAILGLVVTVISLLWQIITFAWPGSRKAHSGTFSKLDDAPWPTPGWRSAPSLPTGADVHAREAAGATWVLTSIDPQPPEPEVRAVVHAGP